MNTRDHPRGLYVRMVSPLFEIDGTRSVEEMTDLIDAHFARYYMTLK
jgi:hypothetical protein